MSTTRPKIRFTVTLTQAFVRYERAEVDVEAESETDAANIAMSQELLTWESEPGVEDSGHLDIEVHSEDGPSVSWREGGR